MNTTKPEDFTSIRNEMESLFGRAPILSSEDPDQYYGILQGYWDVFKPKTFLMKKLVRDLTNDEWQTIRMKRYQQLLIEDKARQRIKYQAERMKAELQRRQRNQDDAKELTEFNNSGVLEPAKLRSIELETFIEETVADVDQAVEHGVKDREHARALVTYLTTFERLNTLSANAAKQQHVTFQLAEFYRKMLEPETAVNTVIEGEFSAAEPLLDAAPPIVPAEGNDHDVGSQDDRQSKERTEEPGSADGSR